MTEDELFESVASRRSCLADQLEALTDEQWDAPSLCAGWKVRHVVGHLVSLQVVPTWRFLAGTVGLSGFHRKVDRFAREFGERDRAELLTRFRDLVGSRKAPPRLGPMAPLIDVVIHSRDIGKPLGLPSILEGPVAPAVLTAMARGFAVMAPKSRSTGLRLETSDIDWAFGSGALVRGSAGDVALALGGRPGALNDLDGPGVDLLRSRLGR